MKTIDKSQLSDLLEQGRTALKNSYAPYSGFHVSCVIRLQDGRTLTGINIENASYPVSLCAERSAMAQVISEGLQDLIHVVMVVTDSSPPASPCGLCRQFLAEFIDENVLIVMANVNGEMNTSSIAELLPHAFNKKMFKC